MNEMKSISSFNSPSFYKISAIILGLLLFCTSCIEKMALPDDIHSDDPFSVGDTTYIQVNPVWGDEYGFQTPMDISIGRDGHVFIADSADRSIFVLEQDGDVPDGFTSLRHLMIQDSLVYPIDVDIDEKMNVLFVDGSQRVYRWNQLWNQTGIHSIAASGIFSHDVHGDSLVYSGTQNWNRFANDPEWILTQATWDSASTLIDSLLHPHIVYNGAVTRYVQYDIHFDSDSSQFLGISSFDDASNGFLVTDNFHDRIIRIQWKRTHKIQLTTGDEIWVHDGLFDHNVETYGTGSGTVNEPLGIDVDYAGNIYYSQSGEFFGVHKISPQGGLYTSVFQEGMNDIMTVNLFSNPQDIAVDDRQMIYITNTNEREVQVYNSNGQFFRKVGVEDVFVDTTLIINNTLVDTFLTVEIKEQLDKPRGLTVDDRGVIYIVDTPSQRVVRYRLSNQLDENLNPVE